MVEKKKYTNFKQLIGSLMGLSPGCTVEVVQPPESDPNYQNWLNYGYKYLGAQGVVEETSTPSITSNWADKGVEFWRFSSRITSNTGMGNISQAPATWLKAIRK